MRCNACNLLLQPDFKFCPYCGKTLVESNYTYFEIRQMRIDQGLKQEDVAKGIGVSPGEVSRYERGVLQLSKKTYARLAKFFALDPERMETECEKPLLALADIRKEKKWTQAYLASLTGLRAGDLSDYEQQGLCPNPAVVERLAQALSVSVEELATPRPKPRKKTAKSSSKKK